MCFISLYVSSSFFCAERSEGRKEAVRGIRGSDASGLTAS